MKFNIFLTSIVVFFLFVFQVAAQQGNLQQIDSVIQKATKGFPAGLSILIAKNGRTVFEKGYGTASIELGVAMTPEMVFRIGSLSKQFTAVAVLRLMEEGKLSLSDPLSKYIPDYPLGDKITIAHLLSHTSGIRELNEMKDFPIDANKTLRADPLKLIEMFKHQPMSFAPGDKWSYCNSGYILLGYIIEKESGIPYEDYITSTFLRPLDMDHSWCGDQVQLIKNEVNGYKGGASGLEKEDYQLLNNVYSAGNIISTPSDLLKWNNAVFSGKLISKKSLELATSPVTLNSGEKTYYGYGWFIKNVNGGTSIEHSGRISGFRANALYMPQQDIFVVVLTNCSCFPLDGLTTEIAAIAIGKPYDKKPVVLAEKVLQEYNGVYVSPDGTNKLTVETGSGGLTTLQFNTGKKEPIWFYEKDNAYLKGGTPTYRFVREKSTKITALKIYSRYGYEDWKRIGPVR